MIRLLTSALNKVFEVLEVFNNVTNFESRIGRQVL